MIFFLPTKGGFKLLLKEISSGLVSNCATMVGSVCNLFPGWGALILPATVSMPILLMSRIPSENENVPRGGKQSVVLRPGMRFFYFLPKSVDFSENINISIEYIEAKK